MTFLGAKAKQKDQPNCHQHPDNDARDQDDVPFW
jgi:hypothetical protein